AEEIDGEITNIVTVAYKSAKKLLEDNYDILDALAKNLLEVETMESREVDSLIDKLRSVSLSIS
ncbi:hypothetical protein M1N77_02215, partial [Thermodesulfovibrionales bacterium]|nr:hypothetical protein [Thermodesulfovibrionales bacterium]